MKKWILPLVLFILLAGCQSEEQEIHYIAKSEHWKAIYHNNTEEGLRLYYLGDSHDLGPLQITIEGTKITQSLDDAHLNKEGYYSFTKKESEKMFKRDAKPIIHMKWQTKSETLEVKNH
ncbi:MULTISPECIES: hypothetical protein [Lysinibacillus]|uniref:Lipoprotein n=1 Tax=Lysinibacillus irui TaxID=2998077 RepID=A0AAJ5UXL7_9BACI|nr:MULTISPECIES: hypothetical protein [Lysinibacillus]WDV08802.1 hypothetical protein OU989_10125 [Lysinibacillus irui]